MQKTDTLIRTKLRLPYTRQELVPRLRLQERIARGLRGPLTLVTAPAGFGKTTLVASYVARCGLPVAWLSLDREDNRERRFLDYLVAALQGVDGRIGSSAAQQGMQQASSEAMLTSLINDLDAIAGELALVLDDYQFIRSQDVHEQVAFLLEHCPNRFHLLIATRSDPPLPLARLRARGQLVELRAANLRFTEPEAAQFLNDVMGLDLDSGSVVGLAERTEGWIAGLQMAALALQGTLSTRDRQDAHEFVDQFSGTNRYILDYLLEEVLAGLAPETQHFLLSTSILGRLTAPLCDAVLANGGGPESRDDERANGSDSPDVRPSDAVLAYLERVNLFLVPLDDERTWYRYHHLFADLLRARLQQTRTSLEIAALHTRAAQWYEQNGWAYDAIHHASLTSDDEWVERLIEQNYMEVFQRRDSSSIRYWTGELDRELIYRRPRLCLHAAMSCSWLGQLDDANLFLNQAEKHLGQEPPTPESQAMRGHLAYVRSRVSAMQGDIERAVELGRAARAHTPSSNQALLGGIGVMLGYGHFLGGDFDNAIQTLDEAIQSGLASRAINSTVGAYCVLARLYALQGRLHRSFELYESAAELAHEAGSQDQGVKGIVSMGMADLLCEWNDLDSALVQLQQALDLLHFWAKVDDSVLAHVTRARVYLALANTSDATEAVEQAIRFVQTRGVFPEARDAAETAKVKLWLAQGDLRSAERWVATQAERLDTGDRFGFEHELAHITRARVYIAQHKPDQAIPLLSRLEETARASGRMGRVIEILALKALALQAIGDSEPALLALTDCLTLSEPEGYRRVFLDEGRPMQALLAQWLARAGAGPLRDDAVHLLSQFHAGPRADMAVQETASLASGPVMSSGQAPTPGSGQAPTPGSGQAPTPGSGQALVEPLSQRELEVLHLIALGRTNQEIAQQLVVARGTVKAHAAHIYTKLDVANRTEAVARARQLGLLP